MDERTVKRIRRHDLDWLRVIAFGLLILYHVGMVFVSWDFHIKNSETSRGLEIGMQFVNQWRLPLLFLISGAAVRFSLRRRSPGRFAIERLRRLGIPLLFGMLVVIPPQVYYERLFQGASYPSFLHYYPHTFDGVYPRGNLSWHHLWYVAYVLVYALVGLPVFVSLMTDRGRRVLGRIAVLLDGPGRIYLLVLPLTASDVLLRPHWPTTHNLVSDWANLIFSLLVFLYGFIICSQESLWSTMERHRWWGLGIGVVSVAALFGYFWSRADLSVPAVYVLYRLVRNVNIWSWLIVAFGFARRFLDRPGRSVQYANEAVYPFYILHQTVIIVLGYYLIRWRMGIPAKFAILAAATFTVTWVIYEFIIRRFGLTRLLFGMKPR